jgi:dihydrofolate reductase
MTAADHARVPAEREALVLVCAMAKNRVIGNANVIPWDLPEDRKHFRAVTLEHAVIMGRATWDSLGKPLPRRQNIVVTRNTALSLPGADVVHSLDAAIALARQHDSAPRVIGGGQLYAEALPLATLIYLTELDATYPGDTLFPALDASQWRCSEERRGQGATYRTLVRY